MKKITLSLFVLLVTCCMWHTSAQTVINGATGAIPDNNDPAGIDFTLTVMPAQDVVITDLDVNLDITHTWVGDLDVTLTSPAGTVVRLMELSNSVDCDDNDVSVTYDDAAAVTAAAVAADCDGSSPAISGPIQPLDPLAAFNGENTVGVWTLNVEDNVGGDTGTVDAWSISFLPETTDPNAPNIFCVGDIMANTDPGQCGAVVNYTDAIAFDPNGGSVTVVQTSPDPMVLASGDSFPVGSTTVTFTATNDEAPNETSTCSFTITVVDNEAPTITCPADIAQTNDPGDCGAIVTVPVPTIMDNCPVMPNNPAPVAMSTVTALQFVGGDLVDSDVIIPGTQASVGGDVEIVADYNADMGGNGFEEFTLLGPDGSVVFSNSAQTGGDCAGYIDTFMIAEATWNSFVTNFGPDLTFTVQADPDVDLAFCNDNRVQLTATQGMVTGATLTNDYNNTNDATDFYPVGSTDVTFTYTDGGGNSVSCTMTVTVTDDEAPVIACEGEPVNTPGSATAVDGSAIPDNDPANPLVSTLDVTEDFEITDLDVNLDINHTWLGDVTVTLTAPDGVTSAVLVDRPGFPASTFGCNNDDPAINVNMDDEAADTIEDTCITVGVYSGDFIPNEALSVFDGMSTMGTWTLSVSDSAGGDTGTLESWTLNYDYLNSGTPLDIILDVDGNATVSASDLIQGATDNCGIASTTVVGSSSTPGSITTIFDSNNGLGGGSAVYFDVTVGAADITISDLDLNTGDPGAFTVEMYTLVGTYVGNEQDPTPWSLAATGSGTASGTENVPSNAVLDMPVTLAAGTTYGVALVLDATHGHSYSGTGSDPSPGMTSYTNGDVTLTLGASASTPFSSTPFSPRIWNGTLNYTIEAGAPVSTFSVDCSDVGESTIEVTVTDVNGNSSVCTATINVIDNIAPALVCQDFTLELGPDGTAMLDPFDLIDMTNTIEACGIDTAAVDIDDYDCDDIGTPVTVTLFVSDPSGNPATCTAVVTVVDVLEPVLTCPADQTVDPGAGNQLYEVPDYFATGEATAVDNCTDPVTLFTQDPAPGALLPDGTTTVTLTATDEYGNVATCSFELTVESVLGANDITLGAGVTMFPNPAQGQVTISNTSNILLNRATMYDVNGKLVNTVDLSGMQGQQTVDISDLATGVYVVKIEGENASVVKRLIKE